MSNTIAQPLDFCFPWCTRGETFLDRSAVDVLQFLDLRRLVLGRERTSNLEVVIGDDTALLRRKDGSAAPVPIRQAFFDKLMRWHQFPLKPLYRMKPDELIPFVNATLRIIGKEVVVHVEDGEALTIVSPYFEHIGDEDILTRIERDRIDRITRTDHFCRVTCSEMMRADVMPGDAVGTGWSIVNSETGFRALTIGWFLYRLVCSNGAIAPMSLRSSRIYHQKSAKAMEQFEDVLTDLREMNTADVFRMLADAVKAPLPPRKEIENRLVPVIGWQDARDMIDETYNKKTENLYGLFNAITWSAKKYPPFIRLAMEELAGSLLPRQQGAHAKVKQATR